MLELLFLGTGASVPSRDKATSCIAVRTGSDIILMDCGEGSQRQLMISPLSFMKIRAILITHLHGDHVFGLPGLLQTMSLSGRKDPLTVYGPVGIRDCVDAFMGVTEGETIYPLDVVEVSGGDSFAVRDMTVKVYSTEHNTASVGFRIEEPQRPGRLDRDKAVSLGIRDGPDMARLKNGETVNGVRPEDVMGAPVPGASVSYTGDTRPCGSVIEGSKGSTVLIHECTYMSSEKDLAAEHFHSTARQAAEVAAEAGVKCLLLTHISNRYEEKEPVEAEARAVFQESFAVSDMDFYEVMPTGIRTKERSDKLQHVCIGDHADDLPPIRDQYGVACVHHAGHRPDGRALGHHRE